MDETGLMEGHGLNGLVLGSSQKKISLIKQPISRSWITVSECISADGRGMALLVIFKGKSVQQQWFPKGTAFLDAWNFTASEKGWASEGIALNWLKDSFIPMTAPDDTSELRLLLVDGHGSHTAHDFMFERHLPSFPRSKRLSRSPTSRRCRLWPLSERVSCRREISKLANIAD
ncbi:hypothetical protein MRS44_017052 [Fusarium solani]|uniref:uncharacterized protein n=1 Tax=Fusarium solani TaxID=169388 RepID=UPI0032C407AD|nr:hypothetical protein MRS44_017052 [Fusarium solani]